MKSFISIILLFTIVNSVKAQEKESEYKYWFTLGFMAYEGDASYNFNYSFSLLKKFVKVGYMSKGGLFGGVTDDGYTHKSIDVSLGDRWQSEWFGSSLFIGPAFVYGEKKNIEGNRENYNTVGLETEIQLLFRIANEVGIGLGLYGNLNFQKNYSGFNVNFTFGNGK